MSHVQVPSNGSPLGRRSTDVDWLEKKRRVKRTGRRATRRWGWGYWGTTVSIVCGCSGCLSSCTGETQRKRGTDGVRRGTSWTRDSTTKIRRPRVSVEGRVRLGTRVSHTGPEPEDRESDCTGNSDSSLFLYFRQGEDLLSNRRR